MDFSTRRAVQGESLMPTYVFTQETMPTPEEFALLLQKGRENYDPPAFERHPARN
jgi:hypothetical protein